MKLTFNCQQSGNCCKKYTGTIIASPGDIKRWHAAGRKDILAKVRIHKSNATTIIGGEFCEDPHSNAEQTQCPFVDMKKGKALCSIHDVKPDACKAFPYDKEGNIRSDVMNECDGIISV